jgi:nicotinamide riboside kinase
MAAWRWNEAATPLRIAILGASSGKTTLAAALAQRYQTVWVPEYLREFVDVQGRVPRSADQFHIARTQRAARGAGRRPRPQISFATPRR